MLAAFQISKLTLLWLERGERVWIYMVRTAVP